MKHQLWFVFAIALLMVVLALPDGATAQGTVLLYDDFNGGGINGSVWANVQPNCPSDGGSFVENGNLKVLSGTTSGAGCELGSQQLFTINTDLLVLEARARTTENYQATVRLIRPNWHGSLVFGDDPGGLTATSCSASDNCTYMPLPAVNALEWHDYRIEVTTTFAKYYVDNQLVASVADPTKLPLGVDLRIGLGKGSNGSNQALYVDYVRVKRVPAVDQLAALAPAQMWVGLKNSDDVGTHFDLLAEVFVNGNLVSSGQLNGVPGGSSGFNNARLNSIPFSAFAPVNVPAGATISYKLSVRNACSGPSHNSGTARLWFNDSAANSQFGTTIAGANSTYFLGDGFSLLPSVGPGPRKTIDVAAGARCSPFKPFGTWSRTQ